MPQRRIPNNIPNTLQQAVGATIRRRINPIQYSINIPGYGRAQTAFYSGHTLLEPGERVRATWRSEIRQWEIFAIGVENIVTKTLIATGRRTMSTVADLSTDKAIWVVPYSPEMDNFDSGLGSGGLLNGLDESFEGFNRDDISISALDWSPDGTYLAWAGYDGSSVLRAWGILKFVGTVDVSGANTSPEVINLFEQTDPNSAFPRLIPDVRWSPDGQYIATITNEQVEDAPQRIQIYSFENEALSLLDEVLLTEQQTGASPSSNALSWSPDSQYLVLSGDPNFDHRHIVATIYSWDGSNLSFSEEIEWETGESWRCHSLVWSPDGRWLVVGNQNLFADGQSTRAYPFNGTVGTPINAPVPDPVRAISFSPDGRYFALQINSGDVAQPDTINIYRWSNGFGSLYATTSLAGFKTSTFGRSHAWYKSTHLILGQRNGLIFARIRNGSIEFVGSKLTGSVTTGDVVLRPRFERNLVPTEPIEPDDLPPPDPTGGSPGEGSGDPNDPGGEPTIPPTEPPIPEPPSGKPWEIYFPVPIGYATENPNCDEQYIVQGSGATAVANFRAAIAEGGVCVFVPDRSLLNFGGAEARIAPHTAIIGLGLGFAFTGTDSGLRIDGNDHILIRNAGINPGASTLYDGINLTDPGADQIRIEQFSGGPVIDETIDGWDGIGRLTISRAHFPREGHYGTLFGLNPTKSQSSTKWPTRVTFYECVYETDGRQPLVTGYGHWHMVNCVHPRWGYEAVHARWNARVRIDRSWFGPNAHPSRPAWQVDTSGPAAHIIATGCVFDGVANPGNKGSLTFVTPYATLGSPMNRARRDQVVARAGRGEIILNVGISDIYRFTETIEMEDAIGPVTTYLRSINDTLDGTDAITPVES